MSNFEQIEKDFEALERGLPRLNAIRDAIHEADRQQDLKWRFWFRYDYIEESVFCGDRYHAIIMFPELLALYDDSPKLQENVRSSMMVTFRWIVEAVQEFPQISKEEIDSYFRLFKRRLLEYGYSLNIYYHKHNQFYMLIDKAVAAADFYRFLEAPIDNISDGKELCYSHQVRYYLSIGDEASAEKTATLLLKGHPTDGNLPATLYDHFTDYYVYTTQEFDKAEKFAQLTDPYIDGDPYNMDISGALLSFYSVRDPQSGIRLFNRNYVAFQPIKNPWSQVNFLTGMCHLCDRLATDGVPVNVLKMPVAANMDMATLADYFYQEAKAIAEKFDKRNGTDHFMSRLRLFRDIAA